MTSPPMLTSSVPTVPEAEELSPYEIFQLEPAVFLNVLDFFGSKIVWLPLEVVLLGSSVDQIYRDVSFHMHAMLREYTPRDQLIQCQSLE